MSRQRVLPKEWDQWKSHARSAEGVRARKEWEEQERVLEEMFATRMTTAAVARVQEMFATSGVAFDVTDVKNLSDLRDMMRPDPAEAAGPASSEHVIPAAFLQRPRPADGPRQLLGFVERMVPRRVGVEEIGDALERIQDTLDGPASRWVRARVYSIVFAAGATVLVNALRYVTSRAVARVLGRRTE